MRRAIGITDASFASRAGFLVVRRVIEGVYAHAALAGVGGAREAIVAAFIAASAVLCRGGGIHFATVGRVAIAIRSERIARGNLTASSHALSGGIGARAHVSAAATVLFVRGDVRGATLRGVARAVRPT